MSSTRLFAFVSPEPRPPRAIRYAGPPPDITGDRDHSEPLAWPRVIVLEESGDGFELSRFTYLGVPAGVSWHPGREEALRQAELEYGVDPGDWQGVPARAKSAADHAVNQIEIRMDVRRLDPYRREAEALEPAAPVRLAFAAAHLVLRDSYSRVPHTPDSPGRPEEIAEHVDWETTMGLRRRLDTQGLGVAEALDTAQRFSLGWQGAERLIRECGALELGHGFIAGAGADHLEEVGGRTGLIDAVVHQAGVIQAAGGWVLLLPLPWLARQKAGEAAYVEVYGEIVKQLEGPVFLHWLGPQFLPGLEDYFPGDSFTRILSLDPGKVRGAKLSLLDWEQEVSLRRNLLERDQVLLTGDDLHFARLIRGGYPADTEAAAPPPDRWTGIGGRRVALGDFSHALLGILDGIAEPAGVALRFLAAGRADRYLELMEPCESLGRQVFSPPVHLYKAGLAFLACLNGLQDNFMLVNHEEHGRDIDYYLRTAELAAAAGAVSNPELAAERVQAVIAAAVGS